MISTLAHLGGLDEIGLFVLPAAAIIFLLRRAERRAREEAPEGEAVDDGSGADR